MRPIRNRARAGLVLSTSVVVVVALAFGACGGDDEESDSAAEAEATTSATTTGDETDIDTSAGEDPKPLKVEIKNVQTEGTRTGFEFLDGSVSGTFGDGTLTGGELVIQENVGATTMTFEVPDGTLTFKSVGEPDPSDGSISGEWQFTGGTGPYEEIKGGGTFRQLGNDLTLEGSASY